MILVDTSIWIDHLRRRDERLSVMLEQGRALVHPFVKGELALGNLHNRDTILRALHNLPTAPVATEDEMPTFIEQHALHGIGIGYIDAHLLASTLLMPGATLWTRDKRLSEVAARLGLSWNLAH